MIVNKIARPKFLLAKKILMNFGGAPKRIYDWREDHTVNPDLTQDPRQIGVRHYSQYSYPHKAQPLTWQYSHPQNYDQKNLHTNLTGKEMGAISNYMEAPTNDLGPDIAHEYDYESQDLDFQPQSFESQHFRKKGPLWMWILAGGVPLWFTYMQLFYQEWPDADNWRYQRPPPLNYPDDLETPDTEISEVFKTEQYKDLYDAGAVNPPFFEIKDGKKVYSRWAGVNDPLPPP